MGFDYEQMIPPYGEQQNRYSQFTYGREDIEFQYQGVKPLIMNSETDVADNLYVNVFTHDPTGPATGQPDGTPLYHLINSFTFTTQC